MATNKDRVIDGKAVVDEMCHCGDPRSAHADSALKGHGPCLRVGCPCGQFRWKAFVLKDGSVLR